MIRALRRSNLILIRRLLRLENESLRNINGFQLTFRKFGNPLEVLEMDELPDVPSNLKENEVAIRIRAVPVHPADFNMIQGVYGVKPPLPAIPGLECSAEVMNVGANVKTLKPGDRVISIQRFWGTWRTHQVCVEDHLYKVPQTITYAEAALLLTNPSTAYRMLSDYCTLKAGDVVIQNLANSGVGQAVIQIANHLGVKTVNVVRDRPAVDDLKAELKRLGADFVITEEELRNQSSMESMFGGMSRPRLAFNGVGGKSTTDMFRWLTEGGTVVTYGGMSRQPVSVSTTALIFKDISLRGFWFNRWMLSQTDTVKIRTMMDAICQLVTLDKLESKRTVEIPLKDYKKALELVMKPYFDSKVLVMNDELK